ncbi:Endogenous retrovirus group 3 member 1 Env polyprotein, partial [Plecturocebus cupreus]
MLGIILGIRGTGQPRLGCTGYVDIQHTYNCLKDGQKLKIGKWKDDEWPLERIIEYYGLATWAEDGSWGYWTPIYMLNRRIWLQAVLEILTNETGKALSILLKEESGKFSLTNCCLHIDDQGQAVEDTVRDVTKLTHVPVQEWHRFNPESLCLE